MNIVIIEDEVLTAQDLSEILLHLPEKIQINKTLSSVSEAVTYFREYNPPDLIFSDIQLGDGNSFEIFRQVKINCPVIYCTAFDEFALDAFQNNGIDYILKPFTRKIIQETIQKYIALRQTISSNSPGSTGFIPSPDRAEEQRKKGSLLITWKDKIIPVKIRDIALFTIDYKMTRLLTFDNQQYYINQTLEELEQTCGPEFFRANRQYLIHKECIQEALQYFARKLVLKLKVEGKHEVVISKNRVPEFLEWLRN
jgi:two-component system, LytTR family, response regulator LytT